MRVTPCVRKASVPDRWEQPCFPVKTGLKSGRSKTVTPYRYLHTDDNVPTSIYLEHAASRSPTALLAPTHSWCTWEPWGRDSAPPPSSRTQAPQRTRLFIANVKPAHSSRLTAPQPTAHGSTPKLMPRHRIARGQRTSPRATNTRRIRRTQFLPGTHMAWPRGHRGCTSPGHLLHVVAACVPPTC